MAKSALVTVLDRTSDVAEALRVLAETRVLVGVPGDKAARQDGEISNAEIGYLMENGIPERNVPPRPHFAPTVQDKKDEIAEGLRVAGELALDGRADAVERQYHRVGIMVENAVKARITEGVPPPLAESTLARRRARGVRRTKPLIDTGQYRNSITHVVRREKP